MKCPVCNGSGLKSYSGSACYPEGRGIHKCHKCGGTGKIENVTGKGKGFCPKCGGGCGYHGPTKKQGFFTTTFEYTCEDCGNHWSS